MMQRRTKWLGLVILLLLLFLAVVGWWWWVSSPRPSETKTASVKPRLPSLPSILGTQQLTSKKTAILPSPKVALQSSPVPGATVTPELSPQPTPSVVTDTTAPRSMLVVNGQLPVINRVTNGDAEQNSLTGWRAEGEVTVSKAVSEIKPHQGSYMFRVGSPTSSEPSTLTQVLAESAHSLSFWYYFQTSDQAPFDEPAFTLSINGQQLWQVWARDAKPQPGWQQVIIPLKNASWPATVTFSVQDTVDTELPSWVYLDQISTQTVAVSSATTLQLQTDSPGSTSYYQLGSDGVRQQGNSFQLDHQPTGGTLIFWSVDAAGNTEAPQTISVVFDDQAPASIADLSVTEEGDGEHSWRFTAPVDDTNVVGYDFRYSEAPITTESEWSSLPQLALTNSGGPMSANQSELLVTQGQELPSTIYFAVRAIDAAGNLSMLTD